MGVSDATLKSLSNLELTDLLSRVSAEVRLRLLAGEGDSHSIGSYSVVDPPPSVAGSSAALLEPFRCGYKCKWCERECTKREGHRYHSCYQCRKRRE